MSEKTLRPGFKVAIGLALLALLWVIVGAVGLALYELIYRLAQAMQWALA